MNKIQNYSAVKKGVFALAMVAVVGLTSTAFAQINNQNSNAANSGYGTDGSGAIAAIDTFQSGFDSQSSVFVGQVNALATKARTDLANNGDQEVDTFLTKFDTANNTYNSRVSAAESKFRTSVANAASQAETKDQFIDSFNHAKADYFNELEQAKNDFAAVVSNLGDNANQAKDAFIGGYNSAKGVYGNNLEGLKNDLAARLG